LRDIPVVGISARPRGAWAKELELAGKYVEHDLNGHIEKRFGPQELLEVVETALRK
jgi:hypothetical protein